VKAAAVAFWIALQLVVGVLPAGQAVAAAPEDAWTLGGADAHGAALARTVDRDLHRFALHAAPWLPPQRPASTPPDGAAVRFEPSCLHPSAYLQHARCAGPRGPPYVADSSF
jgi:hypothetical protein